MNMVVSINGGTPVIIHFNGLFPCKPSSGRGSLVAPPDSSGRRVLEWRLTVGHESKDDLGANHYGILPKSIIIIYIYIYIYLEKFNIYRVCHGQKQGRKGPGTEFNQMVAKWLNLLRSVRGNTRRKMLTLVC